MKNFFASKARAGGNTQQLINMVRKETGIELKAGQAHKKKFTDEVAVMIDTRHALQFSDELDSVENKEYVYSWQEK